MTYDTSHELLDAPPAIAPVVDETADAPIAATHLWCPLCRKPKDVRHKPVAPASRQYQRGLHGEHLICVGCGTTIATCYVAASEG